MVAHARQPDLNRMILLGPVAAGTMHSLVCECVGKTLPSEEELARSVLEGTQKDLLAKMGMPRLVEFKKSPQLTVADVREYLAECCRRWITLLEEKP